MELFVESLKSTTEQRISYIETNAKKSFFFSKKKNTFIKLTNFIIFKK